MTTTAMGVRSGLLIDTSALAVADRLPVTSAFSSVLRAGAVLTCPFLDAEALAIARSPGEYAEFAAARRLVYRSVPLCGAIGDRMSELQSLLARHAHLQRASPGDLLVAATALEYGLKVVHYSAVFELLGQLGRLDQAVIAPLGSLR